MICNLGSRVVNNYLISSDLGYILIDTGYDGSFPRFLKMLGKNGVDPKEIKFVFLTHAHDDHAGFLNEVLSATDAQVILHPKAVAGLKRGQNSFEGGCSAYPAWLFCYYYVCSNDVRDGAWHGMTQLAALSLKDGTATIETLAAMDVQLTEDGEQRTYTDGEGKPISEEDYNSAVERRFAGMARSELRPDWNAVARPQAEPARQDGERFEGVIILEGMEETVRYEHVRNDALGFEVDYDYENFVRRSEADREIFVSCWDDPEKPENYLELRYNPQDAGTVAANICAFLSGEYEVRRDDAFELEQLGSCIRIDADEVKGGGYMPEQLQTVFVIPAGDGCRIAWERTYIVESEGFGRRFGYMMQTFSLLPAQGEKKLSDEQAAAAVRNCCIIQNPALAETVKSGEYPSYWEALSSDGNEIVVLFRSYTGAQIRYYIDPVSGETTVTELVPGVTDEEQRTGESLNAWDYLF